MEERKRAEGIKWTIPGEQRENNSNWIEPRRSPRLSSARWARSARIREDSTLFRVTRIDCFECRAEFDYYSVDPALHHRVSRRTLFPLRETFAPTVNNVDSIKLCKPTVEPRRAPLTRHRSFSDARKEYSVSSRQRSRPGTRTGGEQFWSEKLESGDRVAIDSSPTSNQALDIGELDEWDGWSILF